MQRGRGLRSVALGLTLGALACVTYFAVVAQPPAAAASAAAAPPASALVGDLDLPYMGLGVVWIRADGLVLVEIGDRQTMAFRAEASGMALYEQDGSVSFRKQPPATGSIVHQFIPAPVAQPALCSAAFHIVGYLDIDYDAESGQMDLGVDGAKQAFSARFDFSHAEVVAEGGGANEPPVRQAGQGATCQCECDGPSGSSCSASKSCDPGYTCSCTCRCFETSSNCTCSSCSRIRATGVVIVEEVSERVDR